MNRNPPGTELEGLTQYLFSLYVTPVSEVNVRLGHWIDIVRCIELAWGIDHGRATRVVLGIDLLPTAGAKERVRLETAFKKNTVFHCRFFALARAVNSKAGKQSNQAKASGWDKWVGRELVDQRRLFYRGRCWLYGRFGDACGSNWRGGRWRRGGHGCGRWDRRRRCNGRCCRRRVRHDWRGGWYGCGCR